MPTFRVSQAELWHRVYLIEAETFDEAEYIYKEYVKTGEQPESMYVYDPEYINDVAGDVSWFTIDGSPIEHEHVWQSGASGDLIDECVYCGTHREQ